MIRVEYLQSSLRTTGWEEVPRPLRVCLSGEQGEGRASSAKSRIIFVSRAMQETGCFLPPTALYGSPRQWPPPATRLNLEAVEVRDQEAQPGLESLRKGEYPALPPPSFSSLLPGLDLWVSERVSALHAPNRSSCGSLYRTPPLPYPPPPGAPLVRARSWLSSQLTAVTAPGPAPTTWLS